MSWLIINVKPEQKNAAVREWNKNYVATWTNINSFHIYFFLCRFSLFRWCMKLWTIYGTFLLFRKSCTFTMIFLHRWVWDFDCCVCVCVWAFATSKAKCQFGKNLTKAATTTKMIEKPTFKWKENGRKRERQENIVMFKGLFDVCWCAFQSIASTKSHESHSIGKRIETFISAGKWKVASFNAIPIAGERRLCSSLEFLENMKRKSATISYRRLCL